MLDAKIASTLNKIIQNSQFKRRSVSRSRKPKKRAGFREGDQLLSWSGAHDAVLDYAEFFSVTIQDHNVQEFDSRWDEVLLSMSKIPSDEILEGWYKLRIRESDQLKTVWELYDMKIHQKISVPNDQKLKTMVKRSIDQKLRLRNFDRESEGNHWCWQRKRYLLPVERKRPVFARRPLQFPPRDPRPCAKTRTHCLHTSRASPFTRRGKSNHGSILRQPCRYFFEGTCKRMPCEYWHPTRVPFFF